MKLSNNLSFESLIQTYEEQYEHRYSGYQLEELKRGYDGGLDISVYANPAFDRVQMSYVRQGLENNVDITKYVSTHYSHFLMEIIYQLLKDGALLDDYILEDCLEVDKLIAAYDVLCRRNGLMRLDEWAKHVIYEEAPYYVNDKGEPIDEINK